MKKLIGTAMLAALLATSAFAQFNIGAGWLNSNYVIGSDDGDNVVSGFGMPWGMGGARWASFNISGDSEHAGFMGEIQINNGTSPVAIGQAFTYIKPIEQIQLIFGKTDQNYLRGDNLLTQWDYWRAGAFGMGEGHIFDEFEASGIGLLITPIESLKIFAGYDVALGGDTGKLHEQIGRSGKLGAAFTIGDIGTVKAGVWANGKKPDDKEGKDEKDRVLVEAAFELTAIEGVFIGVGAKIPLGGSYNKVIATLKDKDDTDGDTFYYAKEPVQVNAGVALNLIENLGIQLNFGSKINAPQVKSNEYKQDGQFGFAIALGVDYTFAESWKVFGSVGYANNVYNSSYSAYWDKDDKVSKYHYTSKDTVTFGVGVAKSWSNGLLGVEFVGMTNDSSFLVDAHDDTSFNWAIPIKMNVWF